MEDIMIRDAHKGDIEALSLLMNDLGYPTTISEMQERFSGIIEHPDYRTILAVLDNEIVGMAGLHKGHFYERNGMYLRVLAFVVKQNNRNKGIGKILMKAAEDWAIEQCLNCVIINSGNRENRKDAHAFYQKMGYTIKSSGFIKELNN
ncbi:N-acetylglutamate synthase, GNAT family [Chitinophaga sp. YR573]|uniref:GNAT family N-acetyltransferase n=1 Tax=Chitinophaga sp. YR573 TaxID=1881040 RepID=UPI0008BE159F|nr:GNAT family N-acetyltransferase [Chitinophaga sp. YR573]SEW35896.1 N-acetylglutamate synthase, GNAT family [Chitinophaga sp. YR573]